MVWLAWHEWKKTGRMPGPDELMQRLPQLWRRDLYHIDDAVARAKPRQGIE